MSLELRRWADADAGALNAMVEASREHLRPFMVWAAEPVMTIAQRRRWFAERAAAGDLLYGAFQDTTLVGTVGLHARARPGGLEIGYWVHVDHTGRGVATAMTRQVIAIAFAEPGVTFVEVRHDRQNVASGRVPERLGFTEVGEAPSPAAVPGGCGTDRIWRLPRA